MHSDHYTEYRDTVRDFSREGNTIPDDEYHRLAAWDEVDRLLDEAQVSECSLYTQPPKKGRRGSREPRRPFSFATNKEETTT